MIIAGVGIILGLFFLLITPQAFWDLGFVRGALTGLLALWILNRSLTRFLRRL